MRISVGGREIVFAKRKSRALVAYLAVTAGHQDTRERLAGLLWSEVSEARARTSLRQELHQVDETLRAAGSRGLLRDRLRVILLDPMEAVDANAILAEAREGIIHQVLVDEPLISDSFLRGIDDVDPAFAIWARARRQSFHDQLLASLETILRTTGQDRARRRRAAQAILNLDPTHEEACRVFMRLSAEAGDPLAAQRAYNTLYTLLEKDYDADPAPETIALIAAIKQGLILSVPDTVDGGPEPEEPLPAAPAEPSAAEGAGEGRTPPRTRMALLVEPFGMNGITPDSQHLVDGFRHELLACLVRFREWSVVTGPPDDPLRDFPRDPPRDGSRVAPAEAYDVAATAYRAGDVISMVLTLRERETGLHLWGNRYTLTLDNWFDAQQDIVRRIAVALNVEVSAARLRRIADQPDISLAAYDLWLRGQAVLLRFDKQHWESGQRMFLAAIEQAPDFARGYSGLAQITYLAHMIHPGRTMTEAQLRQALSLASQAVALDPLDPTSQLTLGWCLTLSGRFQTASVHLELARELNPNDTWVVISAALCHAFAGKLTLAADIADQVRRVTIASTRQQWAYQAMIAFMAGETARAVEEAERAQEVMIPIVAWHAAALALAGQVEAARTVAARCIELARAHWVGVDNPTPRSIGHWLMTMFRFARPSDRARLRRGLSEAGIGGEADRPLPGGP
ncbi:MAG TPA: BTAD domain-containing putative transcriptional regulator [Rhodopila sp.]|uniref:BTAD domain-containing putative transcriptional regulator n=1 Tax=Rhodopila sp. TaxID=2480087 RepID=UPI002C419AC5|nr:BTAD domain-containing putative transcriptional regulator [Rhodopila sp.]HVY17191.1 BTAD domain-containing putative transcriptional regulator [Rhodopila sp.]